MDDHVRFRNIVGSITVTSGSHDFENCQWKSSWCKVNETGRAGPGRAGRVGRIIQARAFSSVANSTKTTTRTVHDWHHATHHPMLRQSVKGPRNTHAR